MTKLKNIALGFGLLISSLSFGQGTDCANMGPICTDAGLAFTAQSGVPAASVTDPTNDYGCLGSTPNPTWYFLEISTPGNIDMSLSAPSDIDFIVYGPFTDLANAQSECGNMGSATAPEVDCSFSGTNMETPSIPNALVGEVYVMLITNYANSVQDVTLTQTGGIGETDCSIVTPCTSNPGTFTQKKNGIATALDLYLCADDVFSITNDLDANGDPIYVLPNDTVFAPIGDFDITAADPTTAQIMWLVYTQDPTDPISLATNQDPLVTPGFMGVNSIIPTEDLGGTLASTTALKNSLGGCGTYWFAPVAGDDGIGNNGNTANGIDDNGGLHWDKNGNGCYLIGEAIKVTFACPIVATPSIACGPTNGNAMDITITGGTGNYTITNVGVGNVLATPVPNTPGIATVTSLVNNSAWSIEISDQYGCEASANGIFDAPTIIATSETPASTCPGTSLGSALTDIGTTGQAALIVTMNGTIVPTAPYTIDATAGTLVTTLVTDANGCTVEESITVTSQDHYIATTQVETDEFCFGDATGTATVTAVGVDNLGVPDGSTIVNIVWTDPNGNIAPNGSPDPLVIDNMMAGNWTVEITDNTGCDVTLAISIGSPQEIVLTASQIDNVTCFGLNDGNITVQSIGGVGIIGSSFSWSPNNPVPPVSDQTTNSCIIGMYTAYVTDNNGCQDSIVVEITQPEEIDITVVQAKLNVACYGAETGSIIIDSAYNTQGAYDYLWNLQPFYPNPLPSSNIASGLGIGTYSVKIQDELGCFKIFDYTITQNDSLYWSELTITPTVCRNQVPFDNGSGQISAAVSRWAPGAGGSNISYQWTNDATGDQANPNQTTWGNQNPGSYTMIAIDDHGCVLDTTIYLDSLSPEAIFDASSPQFTSQYVGTAPVEVTFTNSSINYAFANLPVPYGNDPTVDTSMTWTFMLNDDPYQTEEVSPLTRTYTTEGLYTVCLVVTENMNGCTDTACIDIQIYDVPSLELPNVFTPNGDGQNDEFFFPNKVITEFECTVFDRWGAEVFVFTSITDAWNGQKFNTGAECTDGVYFYRYTGTSSNGTEYEGQGDLHLFRNK
jgi:gliding motility-associated-like protein